MFIKLKLSLIAVGIALALLGLGSLEARATPLTVKDITTAFEKGDPPTVGYVVGLVKGSVLLLALIQNDCSPEGNRHSVAARVIKEIKAIKKLQDETKIDLTIYSTSIKMYSCDSGSFLSGLPQLGLSD